MDFKVFFLNIAASFILVFKRTYFLIVSPYKTMRKISTDFDITQLVIIYTFVYAFFQVAHIYRPISNPPFFLFFMVVLNVFATSLFFYVISFAFGKRDIQFSTIFFTWSYTLIPTIIWFTTSFVLYFLIPPPRTMSFNGKLFSIVFTTFSLSLLLWKFILVYFSIRFSTKLDVARIVFIMLLYMSVLAPYIVWMYLSNIFRVPFL